MQIVKGVGISVVLVMLSVGCKEQRDSPVPKTPPETPLQQVDEILNGGGGEKPPKDPVNPIKGEGGGETELPEIPVAAPVPDKPGFVISPYNGKWIDVTGAKPGTVRADPDPQFAEEKKFFRVPEIPVQPQVVPSEEGPGEEAPEAQPDESDQPEV